MKKNKEQKFYKITEAAKILRFSPFTLYRWIRSGRLKAVKVGNRSYRITEKTISVFLDQ